MKREDEIILGRIKWLMALRIFLVTSLLGIPLLLQLNYLKNPWSITTFYFLIGSTYFLTLVYALFISRTRYPLFFVSVQLGIDLLFETALIVVTGGIQSPFSFLYVITIVSACIFFHRKGGVLTAAAATFLFGTVVNLQYAHVPPFNSPSLLGEKEVFYMLFLYMITFFTVGSLSGRLSERLHEKEVGFSKLRVFTEDIVESISSGLVTTDLSGKITSFNRSASEMTGFRAEEAVGSIWWELFSWGEIRDRYRDLAITGVPQRFDGEISTKQGERCLLGVTISPLRNEHGGQIGIIGTFQDLTQLKSLEEEMQKKERLATIGEMAAGMAHEIRNPLASLSGSIEVLKGDLNLRDEHLKLMEIAVREADRLNSIITQFLLYAKPLPPRRRRTDLHALLSETVQLLQNHPEYHDRIKVSLLIPSEPQMILIDPDQIRQVFWNLSINAFQAMPEEGVLTISTRRSRPKKGKGAVVSDERIEVLFADTGGGIQKGDLPKIFYPFFTTKSSGSGLGLSIVQRIIEEHAGEIRVESSSKGTTFFITLPLDELTRSERLDIEDSRPERSPAADRPSDLFQSTENRLKSLSV
ncbi:two-component system sensor histidine kinase NtrB [Candidatus Manganitrophus noduliformans]|uniref:histidine kinase n=1 Tax=Candidatus Manganitrophus noduliformans TaxID=2606439 RepID=A0A7X6DR51_9BACT|nr:ATP-binding protein [Candidatus Manganitrophus noduliformans]NKE71568.1 PAS domain S-box protein [Candidatus Manganitrophus noduliformans]